MAVKKNRYNKDYDTTNEKGGMRWQKENWNRDEDNIDCQQKIIEKKIKNEEISLKGN